MVGLHTLYAVMMTMLQSNQNRTLYKDIQVKFSNLYCIRIVHVQDHLMSTE